MKSKIIKFFFKTCPKTGRIRGINDHNIWLKILFPLTGILAVIWFLLRVVPKPSRIYYHCQQVVAPIAISTLTYFGSIVGFSALLKRIPKLIHKRKYLAATGSVFLLVMIGAIFIIQNSDTLLAKVRPQHEWIPKDGPNEPIGIAKGIYPGRVVWSRNTNVSNWYGEFGEGYYWEEKFTNQDTVCQMVSESLLKLTETDQLKDAWLKLFTYYNLKHGKGERGYIPGEKIAFKINCNNAYGGYADKDNQIDQSKQTVLALLRQLVNEAQVDQKDICVYEACRVIPDRIYSPCHREFPEVLWMDSQGNNENGRIPVIWKQDVIHYSGKTQCGSAIPQYVYDADYLINMTLVKGHISFGVTLTAKNHYGTINKQDHPWLKPGDYSPFVDFIGSKYVGEKTLLYILDGLYGIRDVNDPVTNEFAAWNNLFEGEWLSSIFVSQDPLAIDAVGYDLLRNEFHERLGRGSGAAADVYMHEAALADNPPSGTEYVPDGIRLKSIGVHEHWNNARDMQYSKDLDPQAKNGIELIKLFHQ